MKRTMLTAAVAVWLALAGPAAKAATVSLLPNEEAARRGATHVWEFSHDDLTATTDNGTQTNTMTVFAKQAVTFVGMELATAVTAATTIGELGRKVYTADDTVDVIRTANNSGEDLEDYTAGAVRFYFKIEDAR
jgi:hypothetical protein